MIVDEVDWVEATDDITTQRIAELKQLLHHARHTIGVSATLLDTVCLHREQLTRDNVIFLEPSHEYRGFLDLSFCAVDGSSTSSSSVSANLLDTAQLAAYVSDFVGRSCQEKRACVSLVSVSRAKAPNREAQDALAEMFPALPILVYNGDGIRYKKGDEVMESTLSIAEFLQFLYDAAVAAGNPLTHLLILAGALADRGISFVSSDFTSLHLTEHYLLVDDASNEAFLLQKLRLCGVYPTTKKNLPLTLYTTEETYRALREAFLHQEEIFEYIREHGELPRVIVMAAGKKSNKRKLGKLSAEEAGIRFTDEEAEDTSFPLSLYK